MATPNALLAANMSDLTKAGLRELTRLRYTDIAPTLQDYVGMRSLFQSNRVQLDSGYGIQWDVNVSDPDAAANVGMGATDVVDVVDTLQQATADWRMSSTYYAMIGPEEQMNSGKSKIVELKDKRRKGSLKSLAYLMETNLWGAPVSSTDDLTPWGVNTWIVKNATAGFNGGAPSGYTTIGGLNPSTYPGWKNYTAPYTNITKADGIKAWRLAARKTGFKPPIDGIPTTSTGVDYGFYTTLSVTQNVEELLEAQNDDLGADVASMDGQAIFLRRPVNWVPALDSDTTNPIYGIDWGSFKTYVLQGWWLRETAVPVYPNQHTVSAWFIDLVYQMVCLDRRKQFVISTGTTYPN